MNSKQLMNKAADNIRILTAAMVEKAKSGHPGGAMGGADFINVLYSEFLVYDPENPLWEGRDRFFLDPGHMLPLFAKYKITTFCAPPTMYRMLIKQDLSRFDLSSIEHSSTAGEALNPEVFRQFEKHTGLKIMEGFGQSESTLIIGNLSGGSHKMGSMGKPVPLYDVHLLSVDGVF